MSARLSINGLIMPPDFPTEVYETIFKRISKIGIKPNSPFEQFAGGWNAVAYRFAAVAECDRSLCKSLAVDIEKLDPETRHRQERDLFDFFGSGFSVFEAMFYGLFSLGAAISPATFPIATAKDQQRITPTTTVAATAKALAGDPINAALQKLVSDSSYIEWREIRNILTHRAAPGRTFFVGIGGDDVLPDQWKIKNIPLDAKMSPAWRRELARLLSDALTAIEQFSKVRF